MLAFDDMICLLSSKKLNLIVIELFITGWKLSIFLVFVAQSCFAVQKNIKLNSTLYLIMEIPNKRQLQQTAFNHSSGIGSEDLELFQKNVPQNHILF